MKTTNIIITLILFLPSIIFAQNYIPEKQEQNIKLSGKYYWDEGNNFDITSAYKEALNNLTERIIVEVACKTQKREEILKELEMKANIGQIRQEGMSCVLAWIAKDSVFVTTRRPLNPSQNQVITTVESKIVETPANTTNLDSNKGNVNDAVLQELINCKNYKDIDKVAIKYGFVKGDFNSSKGFDRPNLCFIAVFDSNLSLVALLDKGDTYRKDLLSGQTIQNPETYYHNNGCDLWYLQRK